MTCQITRTVPRCCACESDAFMHLQAPHRRRDRASYKGPVAVAGPPIANARRAAAGSGSPTTASDSLPTGLQRRRGPVAHRRASHHTSLPVHHH
uniref:Uncharacterized protein n=1 Tax=Arundo donax TaxID=35708 RepID=A0A0A9A1C8_ARUDO